MTALAWLDGRYLPHAAARVSADDRAFLFADAVYEVVAVYEGRFVDAGEHMARLGRSLAGLKLVPSWSEAALSLAACELLRRNRIAYGFLYLQISRGAAPRGHAFPDPPVRATTWMTAVRRPPPPPVPAGGDRVRTLPDARWARADLKTVSLLANCLALEEARNGGQDAAWLVDEEGRVREGAASNAWIVSKSGVLTTPPLSERILGGCTREVLLRLAEGLQLPVEERAFTAEEAREAREAFASSSSLFIKPVASIDGQTLPDGAPGPVATRLYEAFLARFEQGEGLSDGLVARQAVG